MVRWRHCFPARQLRARPLACFALAFLLGILIAQHWTVSPGACLVGLIASLVAALLMSRLRRRCAALLLLVGLFAGMGRMTLALLSVPEVQTRYSVHMAGTIASEPFTNPETGRVISRFALDTADGEPSDLCLRLYLRGDPEPLSEIAYGQRLELTGHIWKNDPVTNPFEFDFGAYLRREGMSAIATAKIEDVTTAGIRRDLQSLRIEVRSAIAARIDRLFPGSAALARALVLGDRSLLSDEMRDQLNATGTAHLIAISGLHVTVLAFALALLLGRFLPRKIANLVALLPLILYGGLIGFTPSFLRALVMFAVMSGVPIFGLPSDAVTRLCVALILCLAIRPMGVSEAGFVLSFSASAGILLLMPPIQSLLGIVPHSRRNREEALTQRLPRRLGTYLADTLCASIAAQLATLPAVIAWFGVQSVVSLPFNLLCVPLCMAGYILCLAALLLSLPLLPLGMLLARLPDALFCALLGITRFSANLPVTTVRIGRYPTLLVLLHCGIILAASELSRIRLQIRKFLPLSLIAVAGISTLVAWSLAWPFSVTFLDAEQADCAVVRTRGHTWMFDVGDTYTPAADYLNATCLHLDGVVLSHPHQDHAGGLSSLLSSFAPDAIYVPVGWFEAEETAPAVLEGIALAQDMGIPIVELRAGDRVPLSADCEMTVWSPQEGAPLAEVNDMSLLTLVRRGERSVLFTGDLTTSGEPELLPDCDVLKAAHHGADNAGSERFLQAVTPDIIVISVGENNFGHPGGEALQRMEDTGANILRTDRLGAITLRPEGGGWHIDSYLEASNDLE